MRTALLFPTVEYGIFFLLVLALAWGLRRMPRAHKALLLVASYAFYAFWDVRFLPLLIGLSLLAVAVGRALQLERAARARKALLAVGISLALATLVAFKYLGFFASTAVNLLGFLGRDPSAVRLPELLLPVGISFFVFHAISLMVDAYRGQIPVWVKPLDGLLYVAFFPQLVAGPILRAHSFLPQLATAPNPEAIDVAAALELITLGLVKKVLIATIIAGRLVDPVFDSFAERSSLEVLLAIYGYAAQIYCDFSGYSDIAIGSALLLGYRMPANFNAPYLATSPRDFWHRWHISLSSWLRDYLFIPLGGSRRGPGRKAVNLALTMLLGGLWHGAAWTFALWGAFHAAGLVVHRWWAASRAALLQLLRASEPWKWLSRLLTFHFVCLGWVLFRAPSTESVGELLRALGRWKGAAPVSAMVLIALAVGLAAQLCPPVLRTAVRRRFSELPLVLQGLAFATALLLIEAFGPQGVAPFIYFQF